MNRIPIPDTTISFEKSAKPLLLDLKASSSWLVFLVALHLLAGTAVAITSLGAGTKAMLLLFTAASMLYQYRLQQTPIQLVWRTGNRWFIDEQAAPASLVSINFFSRWLVIISLLPQTESNNGTNSSHTSKQLIKALLNRAIHKRKFIIPFDSLPEDSFRLLRVRLRIEGYESINPPEEIIR